tara:strand:+ start:12 stop:233 length:222 start_codon:yes stop_codon:yes gene_type:complete
VEVLMAVTKKPVRKKTSSSMLSKLEKHEAECLIRYQHIEERLKEQNEKLKDLDKKIYGIGILIVVVAGLEKLF